MVIYTMPTNSKPTQQRKSRKSRKSRAGRAEKPRKSRKSRAGRAENLAKPRKPRKSTKKPAAKTAPQPQLPKPNLQGSRAAPTMSLTQLQMLAKSRGIPFGGLSKSLLIEKINKYKNY